MTSAEELDPALLKELNLLDAALSDVDIEVIAKQWLMTKDILAARQRTIAKIPGFWGEVFDNAISELEAPMTRTDIKIFTEALVALEVDRFEIPASAKPTDAGLANFGEPRSVKVTFHFKENEWFSDSKLEKTFYYRYDKTEDAGLVSEPLKIHWKPGKDVTEGLTDAVYALWQAQKANPSQQLDAVLTREARKVRDAAARELPEYKALSELLQEHISTGANSFFNFFSYRGRWVSAAESVEAKAEFMAKRQAAMAGQDEPEQEEEDDDDEPAEEAVETFMTGHEAATALTDDVFPSAIDYFLADQIDIDGDFDDDDDDEDEDEDDDDVEMS